MQWAGLSVSLGITSAMKVATNVEGCSSAVVCLHLVLLLLLGCFQMWVRNGNSPRLNGGCIITCRAGYWEHGHITPNFAWAEGQTG